MTYRIIFDDQWFRTIPSCMIDARAGTPLAGATGIVIQGYIDEKLIIAADNITYKVETINGVLAAVFVINSKGLLLFSVIRAAFKQFSEDIEAEIGSFIQGNNWVYDL